MKHLVIFVISMFIGNFILIIKPNIPLEIRTLAQSIESDKSETSIALTPQLDSRLSQDELEFQWHQAMMSTLDIEESDLSLNALYEERRLQILNEELAYFASKIDYEACEQQNQMVFDTQNLDAFLQSIQSEREAFIEQYFGELPQSASDIELLSYQHVVENEHYLLAYISFPSRLEHVNIYAYILIPKQPAPSSGYPVVIIHHANNDNIEAMVGISSVGRNRSNSAAIEYAKRGSIVIVPYLIDDADTRLEIMMVSQMFNERPYKHLVQRVISIVDWLYAQDIYPISRIGVHGLSYGGTLALWSGILDERIDTIAISNSIRDYAYWLYGSSDEPSINFNKILFLIDYCRWPAEKQLLFLIPKRVYIESSTLDKNLSGRYFGADRFSDVPLDMTRIMEITDQVQIVYAQLNLSHRFEAVVFDGEHVINTQQAVPRIIKQLTRSE